MEFASLELGIINKQWNGARINLGEKWDLGKIWARKWNLYSPSLLGPFLNKEGIGRTKRCLFNYTSHNRKCIDLYRNTVHTCGLV